MSTAIEFNNISKQYRLGLVSGGTIRDDFQRWWTMNILHKEDPFLKVGETNDRTSHGNSEFVWALKDIDFKVAQGDVVGIIGRNGAGKSTLLKILSKVTSPTTGTIRARGRIGSLLEVGTGFHPEMTGRENIFMNGAIMGMTRAEIARKLDEIVDFSGCERYIDTPVKRYSSGMTVRLGFAVAAFLEPEILVVDEVLAVGDAEFQKKAIGKMQDVSRGEGRTVLFVSHNMGSVARLCKSGIVMANGQIAYKGTIKDSIEYYLSSGINKATRYSAEIAKEIQIASASLNSSNGEVASQFSTDQQVHVKISTVNGSKAAVRGDFAIINSLGVILMVDRFDVKPGEQTFDVSFDAGKLLPGSYFISFALDTPNLALYDMVERMLAFDVVDVGTQYSKTKGEENGVISSFVKTVSL